MSFPRRGRRPLARRDTKNGFHGFYGQRPETRNAKTEYPATDTHRWTRIRQERSRAKKLRESFDRAQNKWHEKTFDHGAHGDARRKIQNKETELFTTGDSMLTPLQAIPLNPPFPKGEIADKSAPTGCYKPALSVLICVDLWFPGLVYIFGRTAPRSESRAGSLRPYKEFASFV